MYELILILANFDDIFFKDGSSKYHLQNTYSDRGLNVLDVRLFEEDLFSAGAKSLDLTFLDVFAFFQLFNPRVHIVVSCSSLCHY